MSRGSCRRMGGPASTGLPEAGHEVIGLARSAGTADTPGKRIEPLAGGINAAGHGQIQRPLCEGAGLEQT